MTKERYLDMMDQLGSEPVESEIPVEFSDFPELIQHVIIVYDDLKDIWSEMSGAYNGKDWSMLSTVLALNLVGESEHTIYFRLLKLIDSVRKEHLSKEKKSET